MSSGMFQLSADCLYTLSQLAKEEVAGRIWPTVLGLTREQMTVWWIINLLPSPWRRENGTDWTTLPLQAVLYLPVLLQRASSRQGWMIEWWSWGCISKSAIEWHSFSILSGTKAIGSCLPAPGKVHPSTDRRMVHKRKTFKTINSFTRSKHPTKFKVSQNHVQRISQETFRLLAC